MVNKKGKATLHDKAIIGFQAAVSLRNFARRLRDEARCYDTSWPLPIAREMEEMSNYYKEQLK